MTLVGPGNMVKFFRFTTEHTVSFILQPWQFFFMILAGWVHREQQKINEFSQSHNRKYPGKAIPKFPWTSAAILVITLFIGLAKK